MSKRLLVSTRKGLFTVERGGSGWSVTDSSFLGDNVTLALADSREGSWYAALYHEHFGPKIHRSTDRGTTWDEIATPTYPEQPEDYEPVSTPMGSEAPWKLKLIWALAAGAADQPGLLWAGTIPGGLFRSEDSGKTWDLVESLWMHPGRRKWFGGGADHPGIHSILVDRRNSDHVKVGVSCGGVWCTDNGGETWDVKATGMWANYMPPEHKSDPGIQDPHQVVQCAGNPDVLWCQHHNGVFRSTDCSESWQEIPEVDPSVFGFAVAVHPEDGDTAWFVPAVKDEKRIPVDGKIVVARTRDGGATFETLREGLPQSNAYDITFRHGLDIDETGNTLAFGSTTGSLWVTDDQGDSWQTISTHLPPVYAVHFEK